MRILGRIKTLEDYLGEYCPECGGTKNTQPETQVFVFPAKPEGPDRCSSCGRRLRFTISMPSEHGKQLIEQLVAGEWT